MADFFFNTNLGMLLLIIGQILLVVVPLLIALAFLMYADRKVWAAVQMRRGPNVVGAFGLLQSFADFGKYIVKEIIVPAGADKAVFFMAPMVTLVMSLIAWAVIPFNDGWVLSNINVAILYVFAVSSLEVYGVIMGGWASNSKYPFLGSLRSAAQMISYEVAMGLSIIALLMMTGTLSLREISAQQAGMNWNVFYQPLSFLIFLICAFAETNRTPFDLAECETELIGGYHTEYSSMKMGFYLFAEYANMFISSTILAVLFFGGYNYPGMSWAGENWGVNIANVIGIVVLFIKICGFIFFYMWVRWTIPRFRYDQLMHLGWRILIPLSIVNIMITGIVILRHEIIAYLGF